MEIQTHTDAGPDARPESRERRIFVRPNREIFAKYFPDLPEAKYPISTTIARPQREVFAILRDVGNFPKFFENLERVEIINPELSNWHFNDEDSFAIPILVQSDFRGDLLVWKSQDASGFVYTIAMHLEPAQSGRGTIARIVVHYDATAGAIAGVFEKLFGADASALSKKNLQRLKAFCETGNVPTTDGQPSGRAEDLIDSMKH